MHCIEVVFNGLNCFAPAVTNIHWHLRRPVTVDIIFRDSSNFFIHRQWILLLTSSCSFYGYKEHINLQIISHSIHPLCPNRCSRIHKKRTLFLIKGSYLCCSATSFHCFSVMQCLSFLCKPCSVEYLFLNFGRWPTSSNCIASPGRTWCGDDLFWGGST